MADKIVHVEYAIPGSFDLEIPEEILAGNKAALAKYVFNAIMNTVETDDIIDNTFMSRFGSNSIAEDFTIESISVFDDVPGDRPVVERTEWLYQRDGYWDEEDYKEEDIPVPKDAVDMATAVINEGLLNAHQSRKVLNGSRELFYNIVGAEEED